MFVKYNLYKISCDYPDDFYRTISKDHGRTEIRRYWTMPVTELFFDPDQWVGLQSIGLVESVRKIGSETTTAKRYYLNSFESDAQLLARAVRSHWGVENRLHWGGTDGEPASPY